MESANPAKFESARQQLLRSQSEPGLYDIEVCGLSFFAHPDVFSPKYFKSTSILNANFPFADGEHLLEVGCGIGVTAILAALNHGNTVVAIDLNPAAVAVTKRNVIRHNMTEERVDVREGDIFSSLEPGETFDTIFWDIPFVYMPAEHVCQSLLERAVCDPGYRNVDIFLKQAPARLRKGGRLLVSFGSSGDRGKLTELTTQYGYRIDEIHRESIPDRGGLTYMLFRLIPNDP